MTTESIMKPGRIAFATIATEDGSIDVPCEPISEWLVITPSIGLDENGMSMLEGNFTLTHLPSGMDFATGTACINCCRSAGKALVAMDLDWSTLTWDSEDGNASWLDALTDEQKHTLALLRSLDFLCDAEYCDEDDDAPLSGVESEAVTSALGDAVDRFAAHACRGCGRPNMSNCSAHLSECPSYQALKAAEAADDATLCAGCGAVISEPDTTDGVHALPGGGRLCPACGKDLPVVAS